MSKVNWENQYGQKGKNLLIESDGSGLEPGSATN